MRCSSIRSLALVIASVIVLTTTAAQASSLRFAPLYGEKVPGCSFVLEGDWTLSPYVGNMYNLNAEKGASPFQIAVMFSLDALSGMSRDSHKNAEKVLRSLERGNGRQPGDTYSVVSLTDDVYGVVKMCDRSFTVWIHEGAYSITIHYTDGQGDTPFAGRAVLAQVCQTFSWKRQHKR